LVVRRLTITFHHGWCLPGCTSHVLCGTACDSLLACHASQAMPLTVKTSYSSRCAIAHHVYIRLNGWKERLHDQLAMLRKKWLKNGAKVTDRRVFDTCCMMSKAFGEAS
jgi:hypothetical protein